MTNDIPSTLLNTEQIKIQEQQTKKRIKQLEKEFTLLAYEIFQWDKKRKREN